MMITVLSTLKSDIQRSLCIMCIPARICVAVGFFILHLRARRALFFDLASARSRSFCCPLGERSAGQRNAGRTPQFLVGSPIRLTVPEKSRHALSAETFA